MADKKKTEQAPVEAQVEARPVPEDEDFAEDLMQRYADNDW